MCAGLEELVGWFHTQGKKERKTSNQNTPRKKKRIHKFTLILRVLSFSRRKNTIRCETGHETRRMC